jgi:DNA primase
MRVASEKPTANGGWLHIFRDASAPDKLRPTVRATTEEPAERAPIDHRDGVYCKLLRELLTLSDPHRADLRYRGLTDDEIERRGYKSTPTVEERRDLARALSEYGLEGVPGFYRDGGRWQMVYRPSGFFIPARDEHGRIQALAQRVDEPRDGGKYIWLSSSGKDGGASSGAPAHFAARHLMRDADEITITEGTLKAEIVAYLSGQPVVGVAGVHSIRGLAERLKAFPKLRRTIIAYDKDMLDKPQVMDALLKLTAQLEAAGFQVRIRTWPGRENGLDDYLLSQFRSREVQAA